MRRAITQLAYVHTRAQTDMFLPVERLYATLVVVDRVFSHLVVGLEICSISVLEPNLYKNGIVKAGRFPHLFEKRFSLTRLIN
jgi:hypothetical protein